MSELVADCPRCRAKKMTFDLSNQLIVGIEYGWKYWVEAFCICRACKRSTIFVLSLRDINHMDIVDNNKLPQLDTAVNRIMDVESYISLKDNAAEQPPEHLPTGIEAAFREGAACMAIGCFNAAGTMFRLCIDLATRDMLPEGDDGPNNKIRRNLGLRLPWLFDNAILPEALRELSHCIKEDGNDGAHEGTLSEEDAGDILDFTFIILERIYTEPKRIELAKERRAERRSSLEVS